jgi:transcriptional accessory protein Tex/SPT6
LFELCDEKKLNRFTETFKNVLLQVSVMENLIIDLNYGVDKRRSIFVSVDEDVTFLADKFFDCIDPNKFLSSNTR